jgi:uncharacterized protein YkwD
VASAAAATSRAALHALGLAVLLTLIGTLLAAPAALASAPPAVARAALVNCDVDPNALMPDTEEQAALGQINAYREAQGLAPLAWSWALQRAALWKSADMAVRRYASHDDGFRGWQQRIADCGYDVFDAEVAENLAGGSPAGAELVWQWQTSPEHNANLLDPWMAVAGLKRVQNPDPADPLGWYWTLELGSDPAGDTE